MKSHMRLILVTFLLLFLSLGFLSPQTILGASRSDTNSFTGFVLDGAGLFSDSEKADLTSKLQTVADKHKLQITIFTITKTDGSDLDNYATRLYEENSFNDDAVILIINMDPSNREVLIQGYGTGETYINSKRAQYMTEHMVSDLKNGRYYDSGLYFAQKTEYFLKHKNPIPTSMTFLISGGIAVIVAGIVVLCLVGSSGGRDTTTCNTYMDSSTSKILAKRDIYTHTTTTRTKIESNNNNNHNGGGNSGGGGRSHSSGRSSF